MSVRAPIEPPQTGGPHQPGPPDQPAGGSGGGPGAAIYITLAILAVIAVAVAGFVVTRGDSAEDGSGQVPAGGPVTTARVAAPTVPTVPTTVDPEAATKAEVIAAYRAAWDDYLIVGRDPKATADDDRLRAHRTGTSLVVVQKTLLEMKANDEVFDGEVNLLSPTVTELTPSQASIIDCVEDATGSVDAVTGARVAPATRVVKRAKVTMKKIGGVWKQSNYTSEDAMCAAS